MPDFRLSAAAASILAVLAGAPAFAQSAQTAAASTPAAAAPAAGPNSLRLLFAPGSAAIRPEDEAVLDHAARLYRDASPIVMVVAGSADATGSPEANLRLSQRRALAVLKGLTSRGIPVERFQITARGQTEPAVATAAGTAEADNRYAEITWR